MGACDKASLFSTHWNTLQHTATPGPHVEIMGACTKAVDNHEIQSLCIRYPLWVVNKKMTLKLDRQANLDFFSFYCNSGGSASGQTQSTIFVSWPTSSASQSQQANLPNFHGTYWLDKLKDLKPGESGAHPWPVNWTYCWCTTYCRTPQRWERCCSRDDDYMKNQPLASHSTDSLSASHSLKSWWNENQGRTHSLAWELWGNGKGNENLKEFCAITLQKNRDIVARRRVYLRESWVLFLDFESPKKEGFYVTLFPCTWQSGE